MMQLEIPLPAGREPERVAGLLEEVCRGEGLEQRTRGGMAQYPGCTHWHWQMPGRPGTLEVTLWPARSRLWLSVHANRTGVWTAEAAERIRVRMMRVLATQTIGGE